jgi:acyl-CoA ligase (AMP-forming) (exosortase A-associated)
VRPAACVRLHDIVAASAEWRADAPAVTFKDSTLTYAKLWSQIRELSAYLGGIGVTRGDRVAVYLDKRIETVVSIFGASAAGAVFVPVNPLLRPRQVAYILNDCGVRTLVTSVERFQSLRDQLDDCKSVGHVVLVGHKAELPARRYAVSWWDDLRAGEPGADHLESQTIDADMAAILYTSGSTGHPKGVVLSHRNLLVGAESVSHYLQNSADDVLLAVLPLSFDAGFSQLTTGFYVGAHVVLMNYLVPSEVVKLSAEHKVTGLTCVPPLWIQLAEQAWPDGAVGNMRYFANTGGRMPKATLDSLRDIFAQAKPYLMYGLTEAFRSTYLDPSEVDRRPDSIGKAIPNAEILVARPDGSLCEPGEPGELVHRGALVAMGYWNDPERTAERFRPAPGQPDGLCNTETAVWSGDVVVRDDEGFLYFVGRKDEMIKTSGYRVSPTEIEEAVYDTGMVRNCVALGVDDARRGQHIVAIVTPADGVDVPTEALLNQLKRSLPPYMVPLRLIVRQELPCSSNGKFDRTTLRAELAQESML